MHLERRFNFECEVVCDTRAMLATSWPLTGPFTLAAHWPPIGRLLAATLAATLATYFHTQTISVGTEKEKLT